MAPVGVQLMEIDLAEAGGLRGSGGMVFFFSSRRRHTRFDCDWSSDVCSSDLATTLDGKIACRTGESKWITNEAARADVHRWRRLFPGIAVGAMTVLKDNPRLRSEERRVGKEGRSRWSPYH